MLKIIEDNRSFRVLEEDGIYFYHYKSLRAFDKNLAAYRTDDTYNGQFCKGPFQFVQDDDYRLFIYYTDGTTYDGEELVSSVRIGSIAAAVISTPSGWEFYGDCWKIIRDMEIDCCQLVEETDNFDNCVDMYLDGKLTEAARLIENK